MLPPIPCMFQCCNFQRCKLEASARYFCLILSVSLSGKHSGGVHTAFGGAHKWRSTQVMIGSFMARAISPLMMARREAIIYFNSRGLPILIPVDYQKR